MGVHTYQCPRCKSIQKVRAEAGQVIEVQNCEACAEEERIAGLEDHELEEEVREALDGLEP